MNNRETQKTEEQRFEFGFYINDKVICKRLFNVRDYNPNVLKSLELRELMFNIINTESEDGHLGIIPEYLKNKSLEYLWSNYDPYSETNSEIYRGVDKEDNYQFEIIVDKKIVTKGQFSGSWFPPKVRYQVNIKDLVPDIMSEIRSFFSQKEYKKNYAQVTL
jgi:hypothetical protein